MSLQTLTTSGLNDQIISQLESKFGQTIPILSKAFARVLAWVLAGAIVLVYKYAGFIFLQLFVAYASFDETTINGKTIRPLVEWGRLLGVGDPEPATQAQLVVSVPVKNQTGSLNAGALLLFEGTRVIYRTVADVPLSAATVQVTIQAVADDSGGDGSGAIGNLQVGDVLTFANPIANVATGATVVSQVVAGADAEDPEHYRSRVIGRARNPPQGGAYADYVDWAFSVPGVVNVYPYAGNVPGTIDIYFEVDPDTSGDPDGIPTSAQETAVFNAINLNDVSGKATRRPVSAGVLVHPISRRAFDLRVSGLNPDSPETRAEIEAGVDEHLRSREPFIEGLSSLPRDDRITKAAVGGIVDSIASANGATVTTVDILLSGVATPAFTLEHGQKAKLGSSSYV